MAAQGALAVWVDDKPVLERDLRKWGVWQQFGARSRQRGAAPRARAAHGGRIELRLLTSDGRPADVTWGMPTTARLLITSPAPLRTPHPIDGLVDPRGRGAAAIPWLRALLAAYAAHMEGLDDVADVLAGRVDPATPPPWPSPRGAVRPGRRCALTDVQQKNEKELRSRAVARDGRGSGRRGAGSSSSRRSRVGSRKGYAPSENWWLSSPRSRRSWPRRRSSTVSSGWRAERMHAVSALALRFPEDLAALRAYLDELDEVGSLTAADEIAARVARLDPDSEIALDRALARHDWKGAIAELRRLARRRPERKDLAVRVADVLSRAGDPNAAALELTKALAKNPKDATARFQLADAAYARGDVAALRRALADALQVGAKPTELRAAIDLLDGATDLEPYRIDGRAVIREFEAWEKTGKHMDGNAARVLDYSALWVHPDAASDMLEHEILRIQSQEAIGEEAEQRPPTGLVLHLRVIKPDGSILEPEPVSGKQTLTMPHLEVGDYVEIEHISQEAGDGEKGLRYRGPSWFFREPDKGYWRSEFIAVTPKDRPLEIETRGNVPPPHEYDRGRLHRAALARRPQPASDEGARQPTAERVPPERAPRVGHHAPRHTRSPRRSPHGQRLRSTRASARGRSKS